MVFTISPVFSHYYIVKKDLYGTSGSDLPCDALSQSLEMNKMSVNIPSVDTIQHRNIT